MPRKREKGVALSNILLRSTLGWAVAALLGSLAVLLLRIPGFTHLAAAQTTAGIIGLGGGLSYAAAIRAAGGGVGWQGGLFVAFVWALTTIAGVTPLFFISGTPEKMMMITFYSFAFCGALGGCVTAWWMRSLFPGAAARDIAPSAATWSFSFGLATVASNLVGEWLQTLLPAAIAWFVAYEAMALIIGVGGGCAIVQFLRAKASQGMQPAFPGIDRDLCTTPLSVTPASPAPESGRGAGVQTSSRRIPHRSPGQAPGTRNITALDTGFRRCDDFPNSRSNSRLSDPHRAAGEKWRSVAVVILLCLPFYLNDLTDIFVTDWRLWLFADYAAVRIFPLLVVVWLIRTRKVRVDALGFTVPSPLAFLSVFLVGALSAIFIEQNGYIFMNRLLEGYPPLGRMPEIAAPLWRWVDLTVGLLLAAIVEETVFRGYLRIFISRYTTSAAATIAISALAFGLIHWSGGLHKVVVTSIVGALFMALYLRSRSLPAIILAHYLVNFVEFANTIPKSIFRIF